MTLTLGDVGEEIVLLMSTISEEWNGSLRKGSIDELPPDGTEVDREDRGGSARSLRR